MLEAKPLPLAQRRLQGRLEELTVFCMDALAKERVRRRAVFGSPAEDAIKLRRPAGRVAFGVPLPASHVGNALRLGELCFATPELLCVGVLAFLGSTLF